jgi:hypothetical protein
VVPEKSIRSAVVREVARSKTAAYRPLDLAIGVNEEGAAQRLLLNVNGCQSILL